MGVLVMLALVLIWSLAISAITMPPMWITLSVQGLLVFGAFIFGASWILRRNRNPIRMTLGMTGAHPLFFIAAGVGVLFAGALCDEVASLLHLWNPEFFSTGTMGEISDAIAKATPIGFVVLSVTLSLLPAVGEEIMFRGLVLRSFKRDMPAYFAVIYSAILFGIVHFSWLQGTAAGLLGCYLGAIVIFSRSIYPAMLAHLINNLSWCLLSHYQPGFMDEVLKEGHSLLSIGISLIITAASVVLMWQLARRRR